MSLFNDIGGLNFGTPSPKRVTITRIRDKFEVLLLTRRVHGDRVTDFFKLCEIKVSLCSKKLTKTYDPLFRNTRENRDNTWEKIFEICNVLYLETNKRS